MDSSITQMQHYFPYAKLLDILIVIIGAFLGATISYFFTRWKFHREVLYQKKIESHINFYRSLCSLQDAIHSIEPAHKIMEKYDLVLIAYREAYFFMSQSVYDFLKPFIIYDIDKQMEKRVKKLYPSIQITKIPHGFNFKDLSDDQLRIIYEDIFSKISSELPIIAKKLKSDLGSFKLGTKFSK